MLLTLSSTDMSNQTVFQGQIWLLQIEVEKKVDEIYEEMTNKGSLETIVLQSGPGFANEKSAIAHIWKWTWKSGGCCQEGKLLGKKSKEVLGEIFPIDFFSFLDKRSEVLRQRSGNFLFLKSLARHWKSVNVLALQHIRLLLTINKLICFFHSFSHPKTNALLGVYFCTQNRIAINLVFSCFQVFISWWFIFQV